MKKKFLFLAFAALALVACGDHNNEPIDESVMPKGEPTDMECSINIPESAFNVMEKSYAEAESYLTQVGWIKDLESSPNGYYFVCGDIADVPGPRAEFVPGPRSAMWLGVTDGKISSASVEMWCVVSEKPYQQVGLWDAWIHKKLKTYDHWSASISVMGEDLRSYSDFTRGDHQRFYTELPTLDDNQIYGVDIDYFAKYGISIMTSRTQEHVRIKLHVGVYTHI